MSNQLPSPEDLWAKSWLMTGWEAEVAVLERDLASAESFFTEFESFLAKPRGGRFGLALTDFRFILNKFEIKLDSVLVLLGAFVDPSTESVMPWIPTKLGEKLENHLLRATAYYRFRARRQGAPCVVSRSARNSHWSTPLTASHVSRPYPDGAGTRMSSGLVANNNLPKDFAGDTRPCVPEPGDFDFDNDFLPGPQLQDNQAEQSRRAQAQQAQSSAAPQKPQTPQDRERTPQREQAIRQKFAEDVRAQSSAAQQKPETPHDRERTPQSEQAIRQKFAEDVRARANSC